MPRTGIRCFLIHVLVHGFNYGKINIISILNELGLFMTDIVFPFFIVQTSKTVS